MSNATAGDGRMGQERFRAACAVAAGQGITSDAARRGLRTTYGDRETAEYACRAVNTGASAAFQSVVVEGPAAGEHTVMTRAEAEAAGFIGEDE